MRANRKLNKCLSKALLVSSCHDMSEDREILLGRWRIGCSAVIQASMLLADCERLTAPCVSVVGGGFLVSRFALAPVALAVPVLSEC
jgi:hypothetical protein